MSSQSTDKYNLSYPGPTDPVDVAGDIQELAEDVDRELGVLDQKIADQSGGDGTPGADGKGWTGGSYDSATGTVTFTSDDGLGFSTGDLRGADGQPGADGSDGDPGADGSDGSDGAPGVDGKGWTSGTYDESTGIVEFFSDDGLGFATEDLRGADGADSSEPGPPGEAATISVGTTTTVEPHESAAVTNSGSSSAAVFDFNIPKGEKGADGSGVAIKGTKTWEQIQAVVGPEIGDMYILAEDSDESGVPESPVVRSANAGDGILWDGGAWTNVGPIRGEQGPAGTNATVSVAGTNQVGPDESAAVVDTDGGNPNNVALEFYIPQGEKGEKGETGDAGNDASFPTNGNDGDFLVLSGSDPTWETVDIPDQSDINIYIDEYLTENSYVDESGLELSLENYYDKTEVYNKTEVDVELAGKQDDLGVGNAGDVLTTVDESGFSWQPVPAELPDNGNVGDVLVIDESGDVSWTAPENANNFVVLDKLPDYSPTSPAVVYLTAVDESNPANHLYYKNGTEYQIVGSLI